MDKTQNFDIKVESIVPEYYSGNKYIRKIFFRRLDIAKAYLKKIKPKKVLDAGCGDGLFTNSIAKLPGIEKVVGIDYNVHTEELNKKYSNAKFIRDDLYNLAIKEKFDVVTCLDVLEHFEDVDAILINLHKTLKEGGFLIVSGPVESVLYKLGRLVTKGSYSQETGPGAGKHYYNIIQLNKIIRKHFKLVEQKKVKFLFIHLFDVNLYSK